MTSKILNLDELAPEPRFVRIKGVEYPVTEQTVEFYIKAVKVSEDLKNSEDESQKTRLNVEILRAYIPTVPEEIFSTLTMEQIAKLADFVRGDSVPAAEPSETPT